MGHIKISADYHGFLFCQRNCKILQCVVELKFITEPLQLMLGIGEIGIYQIEVFKFKRDNPSFTVETIVLKPVENR